MTGPVIIQKPVHWTGFYMIAASAMKELNIEEGLTESLSRNLLYFKF